MVCRGSDLKSRRGDGTLVLIIFDFVVRRLIVLGGTFGFGRGAFRRQLLRLLLVKIALDSVEDTVDELGGFVSRKATGNFQRFIDRYGAGRGFEKEFVDGEPENIAIDDGHARDAPVLGAL